MRYKMGKLLIGAVCVLLAACGQANSSSVQSSEDGIGWVQDWDTAQRLAQAADKPILVDFYTSWCGWCKKLDKETLNDPQVISRSAEFICVKINGDDYRKFTQSVGVKGFPTTGYFNADGTTIELIPGFLPARDYAAVMDRILQQVQSR